MNLLNILVVFILLSTQTNPALFASNKKYNSYIEVKTNNRFNEQFYNDLSDYANSPLVECINLPEQFYECPTLHEKNASNCTKWGSSKYSDVQVTTITCTVFDGIECRGRRSFEMQVPCIKYTDKYFISTLLYSIFLGIFAVDRCCIGHTGIGIGKLITLGGIGIWYIIDIILLVMGYIKPSDNSNWIPYY